MVVSLGQSLTAFMRLWNVSIDSTMTLWQGANQTRPLGSLIQFAPGHFQAKEKKQTLLSKWLRRVWRTQDFKACWLN